MYHSLLGRAAALSNTKINQSPGYQLSFPTRREGDMFAPGCRRVRGKSWLRSLPRTAYATVCCCWMLGVSFPASLDGRAFRPSTILYPCTCIRVLVCIVLVCIVLVHTCILLTANSPGTGSASLQSTQHERQASRIDGRIAESKLCNLVRTCYNPRRQYFPPMFLISFFVFFLVVMQAS